MKYFLLGRSPRLSSCSASRCCTATRAPSYRHRRVVSGTAITRRADTTGNDVLLLIGVALLPIGLLFKVGAVPFHMWTPDVYQGAPTPVTGFMAAATKVAAFGALLRLLYVVLPGLRWDWRPVMWGVAILTMLGGAVMAITQTDIKRLLAYSSIHTPASSCQVSSPRGPRACPRRCSTWRRTGLRRSALSLWSRWCGTRAARRPSVPWAGLGRRSPLLAAGFTVFLLAFAGIPLTSGFAGKFALFKAAIEGGAGRWSWSV